MLLQTALIAGYFTPLYIAYVVEARNRNAFLAQRYRQLPGVGKLNTGTFVLAYMNLVLL